MLNSRGTGIGAVGVGINVSKTNRMIYLSLNSQMDWPMQMPSTGTFLLAYCFISRIEVRICNHLDKLSSAGSRFWKTHIIRHSGNFAKIFTFPSLGIPDHFSSIKTISMF